MIRNNLSILLTERNLRITKVANDIGISRTTLTAISKNESKMIQVETINALCKYLRITPGDLFEFDPLDVTYSFEVLESIVDVKDLMNGHPQMYEVVGYMNPMLYFESLPSVEFQGKLTDYGSLYEKDQGSHIELSICIDEETRESALRIATLSVTFQAFVIKEFSHFIEQKYLTENPGRVKPTVEIALI